MRTTMRSSAPETPDLGRAIAPAVITVCVSAVSGIGAFLVIRTHVVWTPLPFTMGWYWGAALVVASIAVAVWGAWLSLKHRPLRLLAILPVTAAALFSVVTLLAFIPYSNYQQFILQSATIRRGESVEAFGQRMKGWDRPIDHRYPSGGGLRVFHSTDASNEALFVYYDEQSGKITRWQFVHD